MAHKAGGYPGFCTCSMKRLAVILLPLDRMLVHRRVSPSITFAGNHLYTLVENTTQCPQEHNTMSPARAQTHYSSRSTLSQPESVSDTISNWSTTKAKQTRILNSKIYVFPVSLLRNYSGVPVPLSAVSRLWLYLLEKRTRLFSRFSMSVKRWVKFRRKIHWQAQ